MLDNSSIEEKILGVLLLVSVAKPPIEKYLQYDIRHSGCRPQSTVATPASQNVQRATQNVLFSEKPAEMQLNRPNWHHNPPKKHGPFGCVVSSCLL